MHQGAFFKPCVQRQVSLQTQEGVYRQIKDRTGLRRDVDGDVVVEGASESLCAVEIFLT